MFSIYYVYFYVFFSSTSYLYIRNKWYLKSRVLLVNTITKTAQRKKNTRTLFASFGALKVARQLYVYNERCNQITVRILFAVFFPF